MSFESVEMGQSKNSEGNIDSRYRLFISVPCRLMFYLNMMKVKVINKSQYPLPQYATPYSAGMDLRADTAEPQILKPLERVLVPTGLFIELPQGYEAQIRPRSGLAIKHGISLVNTPGTIDADYRGEIKIILINLSNTDFELVPGERIAQMIVSRFEQVEWDETGTLSDSDRGTGGFGSTGKK
jgi:dUTP pyrophosphatase